MVKVISKILCLVFITVVSFSSVQSSIQTDAPECGEQCCEQSSQNEDETDCCPTGICNPLLACNCCVYHQPDKISSIKLFATKIATNLTSDKFMLSDFISDCWNPPKVI